MSKTILIADDDATVVKLFHLDLEQRDLDISVRSACNAKEAVAAIAEHHPSVLILDLRMPHGDGFSVLDHLQESHPSLPVIILTNYRTPEYIEKSKTYGNVKEFLVKYETKMDRVIDAISSHMG